MKLLQTLIVLLGLAVATQALTCWICENVRDNDECIRRGRAQRCQSNEQACHNSVRRGSYGMLITKRCKQAHACDNNFIQNPRAAWFPSQCNSRTPSSVCRCCCNFDLCNRNSIDCASQAEPRGPRDPVCDPIQAPRNGRKQCSLGNTEVPESDEVNVTTECQFSCNEGYRLVGSFQSTCDLDPETQRAEFNRPPPQCTPAVCNPRQRAPRDGSVSCSNGNSVSSICQFECDFGFVRIGSPTTICLDSGSWTEDAPSCRRVECIPPHTNPENGLVTCDDFSNLGSTCRFECSSGYFLDGSPSSFCQGDLNDESVASWSTRAPTCIPITCQEQVAPDNGVVFCTDLGNLDSACQFVCNPGFALVGNDITTCVDDDNFSADGVWTEPRPICEPIQCVLQVAPVNGGVLCSEGGSLNSVCLFSCDSGYAVDGEEVVACVEVGINEVLGQWTFPTPVCRPVLCEEQAAPSNGNVQCSDGQNVESTCVFTCNSGFNLNGSANNTCFDDNDNDDMGEWTSPPPTCEAVLCEEQAAPSNGNVQCSDGQNVESTCVFTCNSGFNLNGIANNTCFDDNDNDDMGEWTSLPPTCEDIVCPVLSPPANGNISCSNTNIFGSNCSFACDDSKGFELFPMEMTNSICRADGDWDRPIPCCARRCPPFAVMDLVLVLDSSSSIGDANWEIMKAFIRQFIESFEFSPDFSRLSVVRYNRRVDFASQILFNSFIDDREGLLAAYDAIPYDGSGTRTGQALQYVSDVLLTEANGDRPEVQDVVIVITDGRAQDGELLETASTELRRNGAITYAVGIRPRPGQQLDQGQLNTIGGSPDHVFVARDGFEGLGVLLENQLSQEVCENRCQAE